MGGKRQQKNFKILIIHQYIFGFILLVYKLVQSTTMPSGQKMMGQVTDGGQVDHHQNTINGK